MSALLVDVKHAARTVRRAPLFSAIVVLTLALGIGATTAIFSVADALLLTPLPYRDSDRLVALWQRAPDSNVREDWLSPGQYTEILEQSSSFAELALFYGGPMILNVRSSAEEVGFLVARASFFRVLGSNPERGRLFTEEDDQGDAPMVAVLTHELWQRRYGGDPDIVGKTIGAAAYSFEVVGVLEPGTALDGEVLPVGGRMDRYDIVLSMPRTAERMADWEREGHNIIGKLRAGVSAVRAQVEMDVISERLRELGLQQLQGKSVYVDVVPFLDQVVGRVRSGLWMLLAAAGVLLMIACLNIANVLMARGASRQQEFGVYVAMGAGRSRVVLRLMLESVLLGSVGCALGLSLAWVGVSLATHFGPADLPRLGTLGIDGRALLFASLLGLGTSVLFGLLPAIRATSVDATKLIRNDRPGRTGVLPKRFGTTSVFVVGQIAMAFALLVGAGLLVRSFARLAEVEPGFEPKGRLALRLQEPPVPDRTPQEARAVSAELFRRVRALPGVRSVATATPLPFGQGAVWGAVKVDGHTARTDEPPVVADRRFVSPGYFETMGIRLVAGRLFDARDALLDAPPVRVVDRLFADYFWPGQDAMGQWLGEEGARFPEYRRGRVVGVVEHVRHYELEADGRMTIYLPDGEINRTYLIVQTDGDPDALVQPITSIAHSINQQIVVTDVRSMEARLDGARAKRALGLLLIQTFAAVAVLLSAVGIYGLIAHGIAQGRAEIGVRMALGAATKDILQLTLGHGARVVAAGLSLGAIGGWMASSLLAGFLFEVAPTDSSTYIVVGLVVFVVAFGASWLPARRAAHSQPLDALRET